MTSKALGDRRFLPGFKTGAIPGTPVYTGGGSAAEATIDVLDWDGEGLREYVGATVEQAGTVLEAASTSWINLTGIHDAGLVEQLCRRFGIHALSLEDILNPRQTTKFEAYDDYLYIVLKMAHVGPQGTVLHEQLSMILGDTFVLTFQERPGDVFDLVRKRLGAGTGRIRRRGHDYLAYALMDAVVDQHVVLIEELGTRVEHEEDLLEAGDPAAIREVPTRLHAVKRELIAMRKAVVPLRDAVLALARDGTERMQPETLPYLRDLHDHLVQLAESIDIYRELISGLLGLHLALVGQKTNEEMRILTVIGTIFIPLTFITGVYGMNFEHMPELGNPWAYPALWVVMFVIVVALVFYFRRRRWL